MKRRFWGAVVLVAIVTIAAVLLFRRSETDVAVPPKADGEPSPPPPAVATNQPDRFDDYVGSRVCGECHAEIAADWQRNPMSQSWGPADPEWVLAAGEPNEVVDEQTGFRYRTVVDGDVVMQVETGNDHLVDGAHRLERPARYFVGSGNHARTMVHEANGYLFQLPLAWSAHDATWRLNPGYEAYNHRFERPVAPGCIACHGTVAEHVEPSRNLYRQPVVEGIGCERCHGPGAEHVSRQRSIAVGDALGERTTAIVNPSELSHPAANDVCLQCHLSGDVVHFRNGGDPFGFRPGRELAEHRLDFLVQRDAPESFGVASHGARLFRSACYRESGGRLTCFDCHDPHRPLSDASPADFDRACIDCHRPVDCDREAPLAERRRPRGCVECHMPRRSTIEGRHLVFTDHWIRSRPEGELQAVPLAPDADVELVCVTPEADATTAEVAVARVLLHERTGPQLPSLERGVRELEELRDRGSKLDDDALYALASGLVSLRRSREAADAFEELLGRRPNDLRARFRLAIAHDQMRDYPRAIAGYRDALRVAPQWSEPYPLLARLHLFRREADAAADVLEQRLELWPEAVAQADLAMARLMRGDDVRDCLELVEAALHLDPRSVRVHLIRAHLRTAAGDVSAARESYEAVLRLDPGNATARQGLAALKGR